LRLLAAIGPANLPRLNEISLDARAVAFTLLVSLLSGLLFGLMPTLKHRRPRIANALRSAGRTSSFSRERHHARNLLATAQVALALVLLVGASLMIRTFQALRTVEPGFTQPEQLQLLRISIPESLIQEPERVARTQYDVANNLALIPGVASVAFTSSMPMEALDDNPADNNLPSQGDIRVETKPFFSGDTPISRVFKFVSPGLFQTGGTRLIAGRDFTWAEFFERRPVVLVSENLARELWGTPAAAIDKRIASGVPTAPWREVVGVVQDVYNDGVQERAPTTVYWPSFNESLYRTGALRSIRAVTFVVRSSRTGSEGFLKEIRQAVESANASLPLASVRTMQDVYSQSLARTSFTLVMLAIAGAMALLLGLVGIYGVIAYAVSQRRREIGIRLALGAQQQELRAMFVRQALLLSGAGIAIGLAASLGLTRLMKALLFGISPFDPLTYVAVPIVLAGAAALASYLPARRAAAVDPVEALKVE
jgi:predicted permease